MACPSNYFPRNRLQRVFFLTTFIIFFVSPCFAYNHHEWDELVKAHTDDGLVKYASFQNDKAKLDHYLDGLAQYPLASFSEEVREERIATWINIFNALVIQEILRHYPIESINQIPGFWDTKRTAVSGLSYSFTEIREHILRGSFRDERALLVLTTGEMNSAPLRNEAYTGSRLLVQLTDQINFFLTHERYNQIANKRKKLRLSPLLREYANDFVLGYGQAQNIGKFSPGEFAMLNFIKIHLKDPKVQDWIVQSKYKVSYLKKDKRLNEAKEPEKADHET